MQEPVEVQDQQDKQDLRVMLDPLVALEDLANKDPLVIPDHKDHWALLET